MHCNKNFALTTNLAGCATLVLSNRPGRLCSFRVGKASKPKKGGKTQKWEVPCNSFLQRYRHRYPRTGCGKILTVGKAVGVAQI